MKKYDIVDLLAKRRGFRSYLEICTPTTGMTYAEIDHDSFACHRLMYRCPDDFDDGLDIDFRTLAPSSSETVKNILCSGAPLYDIVFVDPFHTYEASMIDILGGYCLVRPGGVLVIHDCNPRDPAIVNPEFQPGVWCGVTYQAFIDFTLPRRHLDFFTVDCDLGCGVIFKPVDEPPAKDLLELDWVLCGKSDRERFAFFGNHRRDLLRLKNPYQFIATDGLSLQGVTTLMKRTPHSFARKFMKLMTHLQL